MLRRRYIEKNYPILFERMRGVAGVFGKKLEDDRWNVSGLGYVNLKAGCSVMYFPPETTATKTGIVSRDYDFSTGTVMGQKPPPGKPGDTARPYIVEMHPDRGTSPSPSIVRLVKWCSRWDHSEGLTVTLMADDELMAKYGFEPAMDTGVGLGVLQMLRLLLDTCAMVDEAKETLLMTKQVYEFIPCHYLIADRHGKAFVWEYSEAHNEGDHHREPGKPLVATNFSLHRYLKDGSHHRAKRRRRSARGIALSHDCIAGQTDKLTVDFIKETHKKADAHFTPKGSQRGSPPALSGMLSRSGESVTADQLLFATTIRIRTCPASRGSCGRSTSNSSSRASKLRMTLPGPGFCLRTEVRQACSAPGNTSRDSKTVRRCTRAIPGHNGPRPPYPSEPTRGR